MEETGSRTLPLKGHGQGIQCNFRVQRVAHGPADDLPGAGGQNGGQIQPTFSGSYIREVGEPHPGIGFSAVKLRASLLGAIG